MADRQKSGPLSKLEGLLEGKRTGWIINLLVIPGLLLASLFLPPISIKQRLFEADYSAIDLSGGSVVDPDGTQVSLPSDGLSVPVRVRLQAIPRTEFLEGSAGKALRAAAEAIPTNLVMRSPLYELSLRGEMPKHAYISVPIPNDSEPYSTLDLYEWTGEAWVWLPRLIVPEDDRIESDLPALPQTFAIMQSQTTAPALSADVISEVALPEQAKDAITDLHPQGLYMADDGSIVGELPAGINDAKDAGYALIPTITNWGPDGVVRSDLVDNLLISPEQQDAHAQAIANLAVSNVYAGVEIFYRGVSPDLRVEFTSFIEKLSKALHEQNKRLFVRVDTPVQIAEDRWDTGAYNWPALSGLVDGFRFDVMHTPTAWLPGGPMDQLMNWAVGQVDRYKLQPVLSANSLEEVNGKLTDISYTKALAYFGQVLLSESNVVNPGQNVTFALKAAEQSGGVQLDSATSTYYFSFANDDDGYVHTVHLENAASMAHKLRMLAAYNLGGVSLAGLIGEEADALVWPVLREFTQGTVAPAQSQFAATWTVRKANGETVSSEPRPLQDANFNWTAPQEPGDYTVDLSISSDGGKTTYASTRVAVIVASPTPTETPTPIPSPTPTETPVPTNTPAPAQPTKAPAATKAPTQATNSSPASAPRSTSFGFGIQAHWLYNDHIQIVNTIKAIGFNWAKQQVEWKSVESGGKGAYDWGETDRLVNSASSNGIKVMLSVVKAPAWARPGGADMSVEGPPSNPQDYADFMGAMAARYKGRVQAYEIWNEQNLHYEWGNQPLSASQYMDLLKAAYTAIKAQDPSAIVVSGALTPTGLNNGTTAIDDAVYLEQMYQSGLKNYCDAVGAHPSGYNNPPDAKYGYSDPLEPAFKNHPSFFFRDTMERYRNIMVKYGDSGKKIWPTEFGWASIENLTTTPANGYEYAANVTEGEQAAYVSRAYEMAREWGWVGAMFLWNLNFAPVSGPADEKAAFCIVRGDWSQRPVFAALANLPK